MDMPTHIDNCITYFHNNLQSKEIFDGDETENSALKRKEMEEGIMTGNAAGGLRARPPPPLFPVRKSTQFCIVGR